MRFLNDANLPRSLKKLVSALGHEVEFARDIGMSAAPDSEIAAPAENRRSSQLLAIWISRTSGNTHRSVTPS